MQPIVYLYDPEGKLLGIELQKEGETLAVGGDAIDHGKDNMAILKTCLGFSGNLVGNRDLNVLRSFADIDAIQIEKIMAADQWMIANQDKIQSTMSAAFKDPQIYTTLSNGENAILIEGLWLSESQFNALQNQEQRDWCARFATSTLFEKVADTDLRAQAQEHAAYVGWIDAVPYKNGEFCSRDADVQEKLSAYQGNKGDRQAREELEVAYFKWLNAKTRGAGNFFSNLQEELQQAENFRCQSQDETPRTITEYDVVVHIRDNAQHNGAMYQYLESARLAVISGGQLFVHGQPQSLAAFLATAANLEASANTMGLSDAKLAQARYLDYLKAEDKGQWAREQKGLLDGTVELMNLNYKLILAQCKSTTPNTRRMAARLLQGLSLPTFKHHTVVCTTANYNQPTAFDAPLLEAMLEGEITSMAGGHQPTSARPLYHMVQSRDAQGHLVLTSRTYNDGSKGDPYKLYAYPDGGAVQARILKTGEEQLENIIPYAKEGIVYYQCPEKFKLQFEDKIKKLFGEEVTFTSDESGNCVFSIDEKSYLSHPAAKIGTVQKTDKIPDETFRKTAQVKLSDINGFSRGMIEKNEQKLEPQERAQKTVLYEEAGDTYVQLQGKGNLHIIDYDCKSGQFTVQQSYGPSHGFLVYTQAMSQAELDSLRLSQLKNAADSREAAPRAPVKKSIANEISKKLYELGSTSLYKDEARPILIVGETEPTPKIARSRIILLLTNYNLTENHFVETKPHSEKAKMLVQLASETDSPLEFYKHLLMTRIDLLTEQQSANRFCSYLNSSLALLEETLPEKEASKVQQEIIEARASDLREGLQPLIDNGEAAYKELVRIASDGQPPVCVNAAEPPLHPSV
jgi:hypothetical protein